jgi:crotonobetainyl-CoA:carnitine CoA-transferase CaiB-like acyl-CoA transferase
MSRDQKMFMLVQIDPDNEFPRLCQVLGQPELASGELFATNDQRKENAAALYEILQGQFATRDLAEWRSEFKRNDIKFAPLPKLDDVVRDPQMRDAGAIVDFEECGYGELETVNSPIFISGTEKRRPSAAPEVGQHTRELLQELGYDKRAIDAIMRGPEAR